MALPPPSASSTALVTGASSGIGATIARELAGRGHGVTLVARRDDRLRELATEISDRHGVRAEALAADLTDASARDRLAAAVEELGLDVDVLFNNAGFGGSGKLARADRIRMVEMVRLNCEALLDLQARYLPGMIERGGGSVVNIASTAAFQPLPGTATYAATKAFVLSLSEATHSELKGTGVTVTAVCPGPVKTEFASAAGSATPSRPCRARSGPRSRPSPATRSRAPPRESGWWCPGCSTGPERSRASTPRARSPCRS